MVFQGTEEEIEVNDLDDLVGNFVAKVCAKLNIPQGDYYLSHSNGERLDEDMTLEEAGITGSGERLTMFRANLPA